MLHLFLFWSLGGTRLSPVTLSSCPDWNCSHLPLTATTRPKLRHQQFSSNSQLPGQQTCLGWGNIFLFYQYNSCFSTTCLADKLPLTHSSSASRTSFSCVQKPNPSNWISDGNSLPILAVTPPCTVIMGRGSIGSGGHVTVNIPCSSRRPAG